MHDCCGAVILELVGVLGNRSRCPPAPAWPLHTEVPNQGPSCPALRVLGPRDEQYVLGTGATVPHPGRTEAEAAGATQGLLAQDIPVSSWWGGMGW